MYQLLLLLLTFLFVVIVVPICYDVILITVVVSSTSCSHLFFFVVVVASGTSWSHLFFLVAMLPFPILMSSSSLLLLLQRNRFLFWCRCLPCFACYNLIVSYFNSVVIAIIYDAISFSFCCRDNMLLPMRSSPFYLMFLSLCLHCGRLDPL